MKVKVTLLEYTCTSGISTDGNQNRLDFLATGKECHRGGLALNCIVLPTKDLAVVAVQMGCIKCIT